jgi:hypothetical protein
MMSELEQLMSMIAYMKKNNDYSLFDDIPESFLKSKPELNKLTATMYKEMNKKRLLVYILDVMMYQLNHILCKNHY